MDFEACRFDFRLDAKNGLTPSKRKKSERRGTCYNTLFKCKICGSLYDNRASLLEHKLVHNDHKCPICDVKVARKATLREHLNVIHGIGKVKDAPEEQQQQETQGHIDQKAALREHIRVVRGLVRKARGGKNQSPGRDQPKESQPPNNAPTPHTIAPEPVQGMPTYPANLPQTLGTLTQGQPPMITTSTITPTSMPGYVYINVPVIMPEQKDGQQQQQLQQHAPHGIPLSTVPFNPNIPGYPSFFSGTPIPMTATPKNDPPQLATAHSQHEFVKVKKEPSESAPAPVPGVGMSLPHFPAPPSMDDLEPGEIRPTSRFNNPSALNNNLGMQLPTMVKYEDFEKNSHNSGLSQMISGQTEPMPQDHLDPPSQNHSDFGEMTANVIDIQPRPLDDKPLDPLTNPFIYDAKDYNTGNNYNGASYGGDEEECVVDLSMDSSRSERQLSAALSLSNDLPPLEYTDTNCNIVDDCVLDLSKKPARDSTPEEVGQLDLSYKSTSRPSSVASITSDSSSSVAKNMRKAKSGGLNSMVAKLWQTKIKISKDQPDGNSDQGEQSSSGKGEGTADNPITLTTHDEAQIEECKAPVMDCSTGAQNLIQNTAQVGEKRSIEPPAGESRRTRRKRAKAEYCCITYHSCKVCKQLFESADAMWEHALQHADFYNERCIYCDFSAPTKEALYEHSVQMHGLNAQTGENARTRSEGRRKEYPCKVCGKTLRSPAGLQVHMVRHDEAAERQYNCDHKGCSAVFSNHKDYISHRSREHGGSNSQKRYECPHEGCNRDYAKRDGLKRHMLSHTGERPLACNYPGCKKTFRETKHLKVHRLRHTDEKPLQCKLCEYACRQRTSMNWHMKTRHGLEKTRTTDNRTIYVNSETVTIELLKAGVKVNTCGDSTVYTEEEVMCENDSMAMEELETEDEIESPMPSGSDGSCAEDGTDSNSGGNVVNEDEALNLTLPLKPEGFEADESGLSAIVASSVPSITSEANFFVSVAGRYPGFTQPQDGKTSLPTETKFHTCKICKQLFENEKKMWSHRLAEHDEICKYYCEVCGFNTDNRGEYDNHMTLAHGKETNDTKEFVCSWCGREYSSRHGLKQHLLMKHAGDGSPTYPCPYDNCENKTLSKQALKQHIQRRHLKAAQEASGELPCPVEGCNKTFEGVNSLRSHQASHSEERPLVCDFPGCDKTFREAKHLKVHKMLHTDERPLKCHLCYYSCRQRNSMNWHMKSKHGMQKQVSADGRTIYV